jgi:pilus assembly protein Flp/PilA
MAGSSNLNPQESYMNLFNRFVREDEGQDLIEYALLAGLISLICVAAITAAGGSVKTIFENVKTQLATAAS